MSKKRITYQPGNSFLHQLHPLVKVFWLLFLTVLVFIAPSYLWVLSLLAITIIIYYWVHFPLGEIRGLFLFVTTAALLTILQILFNDEGRVLLELGPVQVTDVGLMTGILVGARFLFVILISYLFVFTTSPNDLAYGLMQVGVPYRFGFALVTALRFVPIFEREATTIYHAQLMRGVRYDRGSLRRLVTMAHQLTLPLLISAIRKVDSLSVSMEGRSFGRYPERSYYHPLQISRKDWLFLFILLVLVILVVILLVRNRMGLN